MKKKNVVILVIILLILLVAGYFIYKGVNLYRYNINRLTTESYNNIIKGLNIKDTMTINKTVVSDEEYLTFNNIKVKNHFKSFKKLGYPESTDEYEKYALYDDKDNMVASFWMGVSDAYNSYVNMFQSSINVYGIDDKNFTNDDLSSFFKNNNITNDIELFEFLKKNKDTKNNIFTSVKEMRENYSIRLLASIALPAVDSITLIDGDYTGYIFNFKDNIKECSILYNGRRYVFTFLKTDYFNDNLINEILNTVILN